MIESVDNPAASDHTMVETHLGLMLEILASSALLEHAFTVLPTVVRSRNQASTRIAIGASTRTERSVPCMLTPATVQDPLKGDGYRAVTLLGEGISTAITCASWATPIVATSTTTLGARRRRRTIVASTAAPKTTPMRSDRKKAIQNGTWYWRLSRASITAPTTPMPPTAKLMIRVAR